MRQIKIKIPTNKKYHNKKIQKDETKSEEQ